MGEWARRGVAALGVMTALVVLSPWAFGSTLLVVTRGIVVIAAASALTFGLRGSGATTTAPGVPGGVVWWLGAWVLGVVQVLPLTEASHALIAPGSSFLWNPAEPTAAAVLASTGTISVDPAGTARWLATTAAIVGLALAARHGFGSRERWLKICALAVAGGVAVAAYGLVARLLFGPKIYGWFAVPTTAPFGPFVSKNHFAGFVVLAACLALGLAVGLADEARRDSSRLSWLDSRRAGWIVAAWGAAVALVVAVPVSLSRGGSLSLAAGLVAFVLLRASLSGEHHRSAVLRLAAPALAVVAGLGLLIAVLPEEAHSRLGTLAHGSRADQVRLALWTDVSRLIASSPVVGSGFGAFGEAFLRFDRVSSGERVTHAENDYLELLAEGGLVGWALITVGAVLLGREALRRARQDQHRLSRGIRTGAMAGLAALLVHSAVDFNLRITSNALLAGLLLACVLAPGPWSEGATKGPDGSNPGHLPATGLRSRWRCVLLPVPLAVALGIGLWGPWTVPRIGAGVLERAAASAGDLRRAATERDVVTVLRRRPADAGAWLALAWLRLPDRPADTAALARRAVELSPGDSRVRAQAGVLTRAARAGGASGQ